VTKQGISAIVNTTGNDTCHLILRGSNSGPNSDESSVSDAQAKLTGASVNHRLMIDCSHGNSRKDHSKQPAVAQQVATQVANGSTAIMGVMIESHLKAGKQNHQAGTPLVYGQSITDACLDWESTVPVLEQLAAAVRDRRRK
jgi:3-deoxy-7-phosphoheptulonate synthase